MKAFGNQSRAFKPRLNDWLSSLEGVYGLPFIAGKWFFVDPTSGDNNNSGEGPLDAFASIASAYAACTDGAGDGICVISRGSTSSATTSYLTAALDWTKSGITVVGIGAKTRFAQRARIANASTALALAYLINVSGSNNSFQNLHFYNGGTTGAGGVKVSGERNYFENCHFVGGNGMETPTVNDYSLLLDGGDENTFVNCVVGTDTFDKGDLAGAELHLDNGCMRNRFIDCEFHSYRSAGTTAGMVKLIGAGDSITRHLVFDNCKFLMYRDGNVTAEVSVVIGTAPNNGHIIFNKCVRHGFTDWAAVATGRVFSASDTAAEAGGITIVCNPS